MKRLAAATLMLVATGAMASAQIAQNAGCSACHQPDKKTVGPSYKEIAAKYKGQANAPAMLADKVRKGSVGTWGQVPMTPIDAKRISDADLKAVIAWVLKS